MTVINRLKSGVLVGAALVIPVLSNGCSAAEKAAGDVCCTDFKPGTDMSSVTFVGDAQVNGQFVAFAQAAGDISVVAGAAVNDVTGACRNIAADLGADVADPGAQGKAGTDLLNFWCGQAVAKINATLQASGVAKGSLTVDIQPPVCSVSVQAQANCQAKCDVSGKCDIKANPPTCTGGTLEIECKGDCNVSAQAPTIDCTGQCTGQCSGSCQAQGGVAVDCDGRCDGTCTAGGGAGQNGIQADGSCKGKCDGKCTLRADAKVSCGGTCSGKCDASCKATPGQASVKCSGTCAADYQPLSCEGGKLEGGCKVDANCQANCNASASAKAECRPPSVRIAAQGSVQAGATGQFNTLVSTLEANLPAIVVVLKGRGQAFADLAGPIVNGGANITASGKLDVKGTACLVAAGAAVTQAVADFGASLKASTDVVGTIQ